MKKTKKKRKPIELQHLKPEEQLKYEVAEELGLLDRILADGWESLTASEAGRVGGLVKSRKKQLNREALQNEQSETEGM